MNRDESIAPFYYENKFFVIRVHQKGSSEYFCIGERKRLVNDHWFARQYASSAQARRALSQLTRMDNTLYEIEEVVQTLGPFHPMPKFLSYLMEKIPIPYALVAHEWYCGGDVRSWMLENRSKSTYYRYRNKLLEYGIDISKSSSVVLLGEKSYCDL